MWLSEFADKKTADIEVHLYFSMSFSLHHFQRGVHLVSVVEGLGQLLTDVAVGKRKLGLSFLSKFLSLLKPNFLNEVTHALYWYWKS